MDMSVKLNQSYPPVAPQIAPVQVAADKSTTQVQEAPAIGKQPERAERAAVEFF